MIPYYRSKGVTIYHGDAREIVPHIEPADLCLTDPPYGVVNRKDNGLRSLDKGDADTSTFPDDEIIPLISGLASSYYVWCGTEQVSALRAGFVAAKFSTRLGVWVKSNPSPMNGQHLWLSAVEVCVFARKKGAYFGEFCAKPVWEGPSKRVTEHPTEKPLWLFERLKG